MKGSGQELLFQDSAVSMRLQPEEQGISCEALDENILAAKLNGALRFCLSSLQAGATAP